MKYLGRAALVLGVASLLTSCGTIGPIGSERSAVSTTVPSYNSSSSPSSGGSSSSPDYAGSYERSRADQAAYQTGHCPLHNPTCH